MNKDKQTGVAMVESVLIVMGMTVLLVTLPKLAKYQDVRQMTVDASRYANWQMTVSEAASREKIIDRMYSQSDAPIRSQNSALNDNAFWRTTQRPLIRDQAFTPVQTPGTGANQLASDTLVDIRSIGVRTTQQAESTGWVGNTITNTVRAVSNWLGESDAIAPNRGIVKSEISIALNSNSAEGQAVIDCSGGMIECMSISSSILVDGWEAEDSSAVENGAQVMVPTKLLKPIGAAFSAVSVVPLLKEFEDLDDAFGCVNSASLPTKELTGGLAESEGLPHEC